MGVQKNGSEYNLAKLLHIMPYVTVTKVLHCKRVTVTITDFQINNFTVLSGPSTPTPCEINCLGTCNLMVGSKGSDSGYYSVNGCLYAP